MTDREIEFKHTIKLKMQEYEELQKDGATDQARKAFEHKPYTVNNYLEKVGIKTGERSVN
ncbi:MAG: hypothetical protein PHX08_01075 [Lachnospiraceae bacterium]|nr:hypothetical protein [Lachnospiraceae bacterium]